MDAIETLRQEAHAGRITTDRLVDLLASQQRVLQTTQQQLQTARQQLQTAEQQLQSATERLEVLEKKLGSASPTAKLDQAFSVRAEEQRQAVRGKKSKRQGQRPGRRGRIKTRDKIARAERTERVFPEGIEPAKCRLSHIRTVWRLENRQAVLIAYEIYRGPKKQYGKIAGVLGRSEFGLEIIAEIAHLVYSVGVSIDKACAMVAFFQNLKLTKAQADALLYRLACHWERQFEVLCTLLANSLVVHADETSWSLRSVWAILSEKARVLLFGVHKDGDTLRKILDPATFGGIVISDHASVYGSFSAAQKCWAHLLRKAIKLTLQDPSNEDYRTCTDRLLEMYRKACRIQGDQRLGEVGRAQKVGELEDEIFQLCSAKYFADEVAGLENDHRLLLSEVLRLMVHDELFTFVTAAPVEQPNGTIKPVAGTNNEAERTLRGAAQARKTGRTNKTSNGARRQTILSSVLESLRLYLPTFTFASVIEELTEWWVSGRSCFEKLLQELNLPEPAVKQPIIDQLFPGPSPSPTPTG
jgi:transposase